MIDDEIRDTLLVAFREEARELLADLEAVLLELEERPDDDELIARAFRALHTIKGNGAMFGFTEIEAFTHDLERIFDLLRSHEAQVTKELIDLTLSARDQIGLLMADEGKDEAGEQARAAILRSFHELVDSGAAAPPPAAAEAPEAEPQTAEPQTAPAGEPDADAADGGAEAIYRIRFRPPPDIFCTETGPVDLIEDLRGLGNCRVMALTDDVPPLGEMDPATCYLSWDILLVTSRGAEAIREAFAAAGEGAELRIELLESADDMVEGAGERMLGEILVERGDLRREDLDAVLQSRKRLGQMLVEKGLAAPRSVEAALAEQEARRDLRSRHAADDRTATIRVQSEKLDDLVDLVGELVTIQARLSRVQEQLGSPELTAVAEDVERLIWELRDSAFAVRMVPIGTTFSKFRRLVRDLTREMGKEAELVTVGAETELDKTVIEKLNDPLVHLIRNCVDHGIEEPQLRRERGKDPRGTIRLAASQSGADVVIEISDDGGGLDGAAILAKAVEKGLVAPEAEPSVEDIYALVFHPGFSTATKVSSVSGRGVGMDVVKTSIESLQGSVEIRSELHQGTTIRIRLPLTLAIIEGLEVAVEGDRFVMPLSYVEECVELQRSGAVQSRRRNLTDVRGELVPYVPLREWFAVGGEPPPIEQVVITRTAIGRVGLVVDYVVGEHQTVIKSLGKVYRGVDGFSGATILGDGTVALLLDVPRLVRGAEREEAAFVGGRVAAKEVGADQGGSPTGG